MGTAASRLAAALLSAATILLSPAPGTIRPLAGVSPDVASMGWLPPAGAVALGVGLRPARGRQGQVVEVEPRALELRVGQTAQLRALVRDGNGDVVADAVLVYYSLAPAAVSVTPEGVVEAHKPGQHSVVVLLPAETGVARDLYGDQALGRRTTVAVKVLRSALTRLQILGESTVVAGTTAALSAVVVDEAGNRSDARPQFTVSDPAVVEVVPFGSTFAGSADAHPSYRRERPALFPGDVAALVRGLAPGTVTITATDEGVRGMFELRVLPNPVRSLELVASREEARTGDVIRFNTVARGEGGRELPGAAVDFALEAWPDSNRPESLGAGAPAQITRDGRFVGEQPGIYTVVAMAGDRVARRSVRIVPRGVARQVEFVGLGAVRDRISSDLWVWEGVDGRDYAVTGTWNAEGHAYFWDVTDPAHIELIDEVQVDARTVNDVKVSEDGRICVITREGASNRRNGLVILDVSDPRDVKILATFDDELTGGVHNVFIHERHIYAINNGRRWDVINIEDPTKPVRVARFEAQGPRPSVHDVWVRSGIAFQAGNTDGVIVVDVGGGGLGGSPTNPVEIGRMPQLTGWNHSVWPFRSRSAGKFYVVGGDEAHPFNPRVPGEIIAWQQRLPSRAMGWLHFIDFDDPEHPREVARYAVPEAGPHNLWIDWDQEIMYVAYFNAGLRVVDISGELMGNLYRQGREIAKFYPDDPKGLIPNAPFVWGPQPHKGNIFFTDFHSGLWAVRLVDAR